MSGIAAGSGAGRRLLPMLAALAALAPLCTDLYLPVLPDLANDLGTTAAGGQLTITAVLLGLASGQVVAGPVSDRFGRRPVLLAGLAAFALANAVSALVSSLTALVAVRFLAGLAAAATVVVTRAVVADVFPGLAAARAYATLGSIMGVVPAAAPLAGGALSLVMGWRGMFGVLAGIAVALLGLAAWRVPETLPVDRRRPADPRSIAQGFGDCLRHKGFLAALLAIGFSGGVLFTYIGTSSFVLRGEYGLSAVAYACVFAVNALGIMAAANLSRQLVLRTGPARLLAVGQALALVGGGILVVSVAVGFGLWGILIGLFVTVTSVGFINSNGTALGMAAAPGGAGTAAGLLGIAGFAFGAVVGPLGGVGGGQTGMAVLMLASAVAAATAYRLVRRGA